MNVIKDNTVRFGILQLDIKWENVDENLLKIGKIISSHKDEFDVLLLPEMFATGFSMDVSKIAQTMDGVILQWMKEQSVLNKIAIIGSVAIVEDGKFYNRAVYINNGQVNYYDKRHLFSMGGEDKSFSAGNERVVFDYNGVKILPVVCYDIRFPVWLRNTGDYDVMVCMANWPIPRIKVWDTLLQARAIENQCLCIGVNRVGEGDNLKYNGNSAAIDAKGKVLVLSKEQKTNLEIVDFDLAAQNNFRDKFPVLNDADCFSIE